MDVSHGCYSGTQEGFDSLRCVWAQAAGYGIEDYRPQGGPVMPKIDIGYFTMEDMLGEWPDGAPDDPLLILLIHYETGGRIKWQHCPILADRLEDLERVMAVPGTTPWWMLCTQQFYRGLRTAAHWKQDVTFAET